MGPPLIAAIHNAQYESIKGGNGNDTVKLLIDNGADVNVSHEGPLGDSKTPLHTAALNGQSEIVEFLIKAGADLNAKAGLGVTPTDLAIAHSDFDGNLETTNLLRKHGGKTSEELKAEEK